MEYRGFEIDEDISDHNVTVRHKIFEIEEVYGNVGMAKAFIDGFLRCLSTIVHSR